MRKLFFIIIIMLPLLGGCFYNAPNNGGYFARWSDLEVNDYFDSIDDILMLSRDLINKKYSWQSPGDNLTYWTDQFLEPNVTLARGWGNCSDYAALYLNYCVYKKNANEITQYLFYKNPLRLGAWHYISLININGNLYHQSNLSISNVNDTIEVITYWRSKGYIFVEPVKYVRIR